MPHVNVKHFPVDLTPEQRASFVSAVTDAVRGTFGVDESVVSIALEPVPAENWTEQVYVPEIVNRKDLLVKSPNY